MQHVSSSPFHNPVLPVLVCFFFISCVFSLRGCPVVFDRICWMIGTTRSNRKGGTASLRSRKCVKRNAVFGARFKGLSLNFPYQKGNLIRIKTGLDTHLIRIQTRTPLSRYTPYDYSKTTPWWTGLSLKGTIAWCPDAHLLVVSSLLLFPRTPQEKGYDDEPVSWGCRSRPEGLLSPWWWWPGP